jgi:hypothetical protein
MSAPTDFRTGPGIPPELANEAREEILAAKESMAEAEGEERPISFTDHKSNTRIASNAFLEVQMLVVLSRHTELMQP